MKLTDEAVEAAEKAWNKAYWTTASPGRTDWMRAALEAALPHLTDDGVALPVRRDGEGPLAAAPSSPHPTCSGHCYSYTESGAGYIDPKCAVHGEGATPATNHRPTCGTTYGESCDGYCPTPAIDREALTKLLRFNRSAPYISNERLADMVLELISAPNSGASEDDR